MSSTSQKKKQHNLMADEVANYLLANPDFLYHNEDLLDSINLRHSAGEGSVSLIERQVKHLRQQKSGLESQLNNLIQAARNNEQIATRMQRFTLEMLYAKDLDDIVASSHALLRSDFKADFAVIKLFGSIDSPHFVERAKVDSRSFAPLFKKRQPICGRITEKQRSFLFADNSDDVKSALLIPLQTTKDFGVLALGSLDKARFTPGMGTLFLSYLGELVTATLAKHIDETEL